MTFNAAQFFKDNDIPFSERGKKVSKGWIGINCPFCNGDEFRLGFNLKSSFFTCWSCGRKSIKQVILALLGPNAQIDWKRYSDGKWQDSGRFTPISGRPTAVSLPPGTSAMLPAHVSYLQKRGFDADRLEKRWALQGTGPHGSHARRIVVPIYYDGKLVSYTCRDITGKAPIKYFSCETASEVVPHKDILYGLDLCHKNACVVVEGVTDVWRLGPGAVATFGIKFKDAQVIELVKRFEKVFVMYDSEDFAVKQAQKMCAMLKASGIASTLVTLDEGDPGELTEVEALSIMRQLLG